MPFIPDPKPYRVGTVAPASDLPDSALAGAPVPASDLPGAPPVGHFVPDPPAPAKSAAMRTDSNTMRLGPWASAVVREPAKVANSIINFVPDMATELVDLLPAKYFGPDVTPPGQIIDRFIDQHTSAPQGKIGRAGAIGQDVVLNAAAAPEAIEGTAKFISGGGLRDALRSGGQAIRRVWKRSTRTALKDAAAAGARISPAYIGRGATKEMQTLAGQPTVHAAASRANADIVDRLAGSELGLYPGVPGEELTADNLERLKDDAYAAYSQVGKVGPVVFSGPDAEEFQNAVREAGGRFANRSDGFGSGSRYASIDDAKAPYLNAQIVNAQKAVDEVRTLRASSRANLRNFDPEKNALGLTQREIANAIEKRLEKAVQTRGTPGAMEALKAARVQLSKIHALEDAMGPGDHVNAQDLARMLDAGVPLTGNLLKIARMAKEFPKDFAPEAAKGERGMWSAVDYMLGGSGIVFGRPWEAGLPIMRAVSRGTVLTKPVQRHMMGRIEKESGKVAEDYARWKRGESLPPIAGALRRGAKGAALGATAMGAVPEDDPRADGDPAGLQGFGDLNPYLQDQP